MSLRHFFIDRKFISLLSFFTFVPDSKHLFSAFDGLRHNHKLKLGTDTADQLKEQVFTDSTCCIETTLEMGSEEAVIILRCMRTERLDTYVYLHNLLSVDNHIIT